MHRLLPATTAVLAALVLGGCAGPGTPVAGPPPGSTTLQPAPDTPPVPDLDDPSVRPGPSADVHEFIQRLQALAGSSPDSGGPALGADGSTVTLYWFGELPDPVRALVDKYAGRVQVDVVATLFRPGDLLAEADRLIRGHPGAVAAVGPRPQGDGLDVLLDPTAVERAGSVDALLAELASPFPLFGDVGGVVPA